MDTPPALLFVHTSSSPSCLQPCEPLRQKTERFTCSWSKILLAVCISMQALFNNNNRSRSCKKKSFICLWRNSQVALGQRIPPTFYGQTRTKKLIPSPQTILGQVQSGRSGDASQCFCFRIQFNLHLRNRIRGICKL